MKNFIRLISSYNTELTCIESIAKGERIISFLNELYSNFYKEESFKIKINDGIIDIYLMNQYGILEKHTVKNIIKSYYENTDKYIFNEYQDESSFFMSAKHFYQIFYHYSIDFSSIELFDMGNLSRRDILSDVEKKDLVNFKNMFPGIDVLKFSIKIDKMIDKLESIKIKDEEIKNLLLRNEKIINDDNFTEYEKENIIKRNIEQIDKIKKELKV